MKKLGGWVLVFSSMLVVLAACNVSADASGAGSGTGDGGTPPGTLPPPGLSQDDAQKICTTLRTAPCNQLQKCAPNLFAAEWGDLPTCITRQVLECTLALTLPGVTIAQAQADACAAQITGAACDSVAPLTACTIPGVVADGGGCISLSQCKSGNCVGGNIATCGKCAPIPAPGTVAIGAACTPPVPPADSPCVPFAVCSNGKCVEAGRAKGEFCATGGLCLETKNLFCDDGANCVDATTVAEAGAACPSDATAFTATVCHDGLCDVNAKPAAACNAHSIEGGACDPETNPCASPYSCDPTQKTCVIPTLNYQGVCNLH